MVELEFLLLIKQNKEYMNELASSSLAVVCLQVYSSYFCFTFTSAIIISPKDLQIKIRTLPKIIVMKSL